MFPAKDEEADDTFEPDAMTRVSLDNPTLEHEETDIQNEMQKFPATRSKAPHVRRKSVIPLDPTTLLELSQHRSLEWREHSNEPDREES
ncbi:hypothetical protein BT69DRAFT_1291529 [Atractiella rhizophila]|nr:hypothetical protein BT69DRAFT_1291529 [Atractiella rhizophila]